MIEQTFPPFSTYVPKPFQLQSKISYYIDYHAASLKKHFPGEMSNIFSSHKPCFYLFTPATVQLSYENDQRERLFEIFPCSRFKSMDNIMYKSSMH